MVRRAGGDNDVDARTERLTDLRHPSVRPHGSCDRPRLVHDAMVYQPPLMRAVCAAADDEHEGEVDTDKHGQPKPHPLRERRREPHHHRTPLADPTSMTSADPATWHPRAPLASAAFTWPPEPSADCARRR